MPEPVRIALLGRPGAARDQLRKALNDLGAQLVAEGDPAELDPAGVIGLRPNVVLVSLEPAVEDALDRFGELLARSDVSVMYDDAEVTRQLDGWDLARWARHLASKLIGADTMPPRPAEGELQEPEMAPVPGAPATPAQLMADARLEDYIQDAPALAEAVPSLPDLTRTVVEGGVAADESLELGDGLTLDIDAGDLAQALDQIGGEGEPRGTQRVDDRLESTQQDSGFTLELEDDGNRGDDVSGGERIAAASMSFQRGDGGDSFAGDSMEMDPELAALAAQMEQIDSGRQFDAPKELDFIGLPGKDESPAPAKPASPAATPAAASPRAASPPAAGAAPAAKKPSLGELSLLTEDDLPVDPSTVAPKAPPPPDFSGLGHLSLSPLDDPDSQGEAPTGSKTGKAPSPKDVGPVLSALSAGLSLADDLPKGGGYVLVVAGLGGPDGVRHIVSGLPDAFPSPVLIAQQLDVGRHDRLVTQLAKISKMPVFLAEPGKVAQAGQVTVLPSNMGFDGTSMKFVEGQGAALVRSLPPDSLLVVLSGAPAGLIADAEGLKGRGGSLLAQDPGSCFDAAAASAAVAAGADKAESASLASQIVERYRV